MTVYILRRLLWVFPILFGVSVLVFSLLALVPGDPALAILGPYATPENTAELRRELALDRPLPEQYVRWLGRAATGDFGRSITLERPVADVLVESFGATLLLASAAFLLCAAGGLLLGVVMAVRQFSWTDRLLSVAVLAGISMPSFWLGLLLVLAFAVHLRWLPASGMWSVYGGGGWLDLLSHLFLPALTLAVVAAAVVARLTRLQMLEVLRSDYIRTARAKGLTERRIIWRHAFRNAVIPLAPVLGLQMGFVLGGAVYVESIFQWPGVGRMLVDAIASRDLLLVQGGVLVLAVFYVLINLGADVTQRALDARRNSFGISFGFWLLGLGLLGVGGMSEVVV